MWSGVLCQFLATDAAGLHHGLLVAYGHGSGEPSGITSGYHTTAWFDQNNAKRYKRANW